MNIVRVELAARSYDVRLGHGVLAQAGAMIAALAPSRRVFVVTDETVRGLYLEALSESLGAAGLHAHVVAVAPGEEQKSYAGLEQVTRALLRAGISRRDLVIAFGGGVVGDLAGLAAGLVKRGVDFVQIPTTLLAQVDSSVGGKTAIDAPEGKNLIGLIHQPRLVIADLDLLSTLPARELRCGYAEIVKAGLIGDAEFFSWCEAQGASVLAREPGALLHAVGTAIEFKARIVAADEREEGPRALLNLGHTFAHALEAHAGYGERLKHGEAVAAGLALAFDFSAELGLCAQGDARRVLAHLESAGFVCDLARLAGAPFQPAQLLSYMRADKKAEGGKLTLVLARGVGRAVLDADVDAAALTAFLERQVS